MTGFVEAVDALTRAAGPWGPVVLILAYAAATVLFIPGASLTILAGLLFADSAAGLVRAAIYVDTGATLGATAAFLLARTLLRARVAAWVRDRPRFAAIDRAVAREGWRVVALLRLSPVFPYNLLNYALGLTAVPVTTYVWTTFVFMLPGVFLYVWIGSLGRAAAAGAGTARLGLLAVGLAATVLVVILVGRAARRALDEAAG